MSGTGVFGSGFGPSVIVSPEATNTRPSGSAVAVGYQRASDMSGPRVQVAIFGSNRFRSLVPS